MRLTILLLTVLVGCSSGDKTSVVTQTSEKKSDPETERFATGVTIYLKECDSFWQSVEIGLLPSTLKPKLTSLEAAFARLPQAPNRKLLWLHESCSSQKQSAADVVNVLTISTIDAKIYTDSSTKMKDIAKQQRENIRALQKSVDTL